MVEGTDEDVAAAEQSGFLMLMSGERHARLRRMVSGALSARRVAALRPAAAARARDLVAALCGAGGGEVLHEFAAPLAIGTLGDLIGVDVTARDDFARWSDDSNAMFGEADPERMRESGYALFGFIGELVRSERDGDGLVGDLFRATDGAGVGLTEDEVSGVIGQLLMAGYVPSGMVLTLTAYRLLSDPAVAGAVRADPSLLPGAVDEMLRLDPGAAVTVDRAFRARADVEVGGVRIARGTSSWCRWARPTGTRRCSPTRTCWIRPAARTRTCRSSQARTTASARHWPGCSWRSASPRSSTPARSRWPAPRGGAAARWATSSSAHSRCGSRHP